MERFFLQSDRNHLRRSDYIRIPDSGFEPSGQSYRYTVAAQFEGNSDTFVWACLVRQIDLLLYRRRLSKGTKFMPRGMRIYAALGIFSVAVFAFMAWACRELRTIARHGDGETHAVATLRDSESKRSAPQGSAFARRRPALVLEDSRRGLAGISPYGSEIVTRSSAVYDELPSDNRRKGLDHNGLNRLEAAASAGPRDTSAEHRLREQLATAMSPDKFPGLVVQNVNCSDAICRVSAEASTSASPESWSIVQALSTMAPHGGVLATTNPDLIGERKVIAFIARAGSRLPFATRQ